MGTLVDIMNGTRDWHKCFAAEYIARNPILYSQINVWLEENTIGQYFLVGGAPIEVRFCLEQDAVTFNLRWS